MMIFIQALNTQSLPPLNYPEPAYFCRALCICGAWVGSGCPTGDCKCCPSGPYVHRAWGKPELLQARDGPPVSVSPVLRIESRQGIRACWMNERIQEIFTLSLCAGIKCWPHLLYLWSRDVTLWFSSISRNFWESRRINWPKGTFKELHMCYYLEKKRTFTFSASYEQLFFLVFKVCFKNLSTRGLLVFLVGSSSDVWVHA